MPEFTPENVTSGNVVADNVPVITPGQSVTNTVAISGVAMTVILMALHYFDVPLTKDNIEVLIAAVNILMGVIVWVRNRYFRNAVVSTSVPNTTGPAKKVSLGERGYRGQGIRLRLAA